MTWKPVLKYGTSMNGHLVFLTKNFPHQFLSGYIKEQHWIARSRFSSIPVKLNLFFFGLVSLNKNLIFRCVFVAVNWLNYFSEVWGYSSDIKFQNFISTTRLDSFIFYFHIFDATKQIKINRLHLTLLKFYLISLNIFKITIQ